MINFFSYDLMAQVTGLIASGLIITGFANKTDGRFKLFMTIGAITFACHYFMLGAFAGAAVNVVSAARTAFSIKFHKSTNVMVLFISLYLILGFLAYNNPVDILPILSGILATVAMYKLSGIPMRLCFFACSLGWLFYDLIFKSIGGIITESFVQFTNLTTIYRLLRDKKRGTA